MVERGWQVTALVRNPSSVPAQGLAALGVKLAQGDVTAPETVRSAIGEAELVVHNAAWYEFGVSAKARMTMQRINVDGTETVLSLAREASVPRVVHVSSVIVYAPSGTTPRDESHARQGPYRSVYAETKAAAHEIAVAYQDRGSPVIIASPGIVIGPNDHAVLGYFARLYLNGWMPPMAWAPDTYTVQATAEDTAEALVLAAEKGRPGESYLGCGEPIQTKEMLEIWQRVPGGSRVRFWLPTSLMAWSCAPMEPLLRAMGISAFLSRESVYSGAQHFLFKNDKAKQELGWKPQPPQETWPAILAAERALMGESRRGIAGRLNPLEI